MAQVSIVRYTSSSPPTTRKVRVYVTVQVVVKVQRVWATEEVPRNKVNVPWRNKSPEFHPLEYSNNLSNFL